MKANNHQPAGGADFREFYYFCRPSPGLIQIPSIILPDFLIIIWQKQLKSVLRKSSDSSLLFKKLKTKIDEIEILKGELPIEVSDLEDEITGLETRLKNLNDTVKDIEKEGQNTPHA